MAEEKRERGDGYARAVATALAAARKMLPRALPPAQVEELCRRLLRASGGQRQLILANSRRAGRLEICRRSVEISEALRNADATAMLEWARVAVAVAQALPSRSKLGLLAEDARAEAWGALANALRVKGDLRGAERAWARADAHRDAGSHEPLLNAKLLQLKGSLCIEQRRYREAADHLTEACRLYGLVDERHLEGRTLVNLARAHRLQDRLDRAIPCALQGAWQVDGRVEPSLKLMAIHNLVIYMDEAGHTREALAALQWAEPLYERLAEPLQRLRLRWLHGRLAASTGDVKAALSNLDAARRGFVDLDMAYDAALAALELAVVYARLGQVGRVEGLAQEMYPVFISRDIPREAAASLLLFVRAAEARTAGSEWIVDLLEKLNALKARGAERAR